VKISSCSINPIVECVLNLKSKRLFARKPTQTALLEIRIAENLRSNGFSHKNNTLHTDPYVPPWLLRCPCFNYDMYAFHKNSVSAEVLQNHFAETKNGFGKHVEIYTDGSKTGEAVACAVICGNQIKSMRLPDKSSVYTAELPAVRFRMALKLIRQLKQKSFVIYFDSLSSLQAIQSKKFRALISQAAR